MEWTESRSEWSQSLSERGVEKGLEEGYVPKVESVERWGIKERKDIATGFLLFIVLLYSLFFRVFQYLSRLTHWAINFCLVQKLCLDTCPSLVL